MGLAGIFFGAEGIFAGRVTVALEAPGKIGTAACKNEVCLQKLGIFTVIWIQAEGFVVCENVF
mgnify:CR=1 FL=1